MDRVVLPLAYGANLALNGLSYGLYGGNTTSGWRYSYVQPDDKSFTVWGLIYSLHFVMVVYQCFPTMALPAHFQSARVPLAFQFLSNGSWLIVNGAANHGFSHWLAVLVLWFNLFCLYKAYCFARVDFTTTDACFMGKLCCFLPISCNLAWVVLAAIINFSNTVYPDDPSSVAVGGADWAIAVFGLATMLACYVAFTRLDFGYAGITIWALLGIIRNQGPERNLPHEPSEHLAMFCAGCVSLLILVSFLGSFHHILSNHKDENK